MKKKNQNETHLGGWGPSARQGPSPGPGQQEGRCHWQQYMVLPALVRFSKDLRAGPGVEPTSQKSVEAAEPKGVHLLR